MGQALLAKRDFRQAEASTRRSLDLLPPWENEFHGNLELQLQRCKRLIALEDRLMAIVQGKDKPASSETLEAAELCFVKRHYAAAARFYAEAFAAAPELADDLRVGNRFNAACASALAGCGHGDDGGRLKETELKASREQARELLQLDLTAWTKKLDSGTPADRIQAGRMLPSWRENPYLAGLRNPRSLDKLPPDERQELRTLWRQVDALIERTRSAN